MAVDGELRSHRGELLVGRGDGYWGRGCPRLGAEQLMFHSGLSRERIDELGNIRRAPGGRSRAKLDAGRKSPPRYPPPPGRPAYGDDGEDSWKSQKNVDWSKDLIHE